MCHRCVHACVPACRGEAAIPQGHGINSTPNLIWGCGRVAMRAVGGWAPSARKLTSPHRAAHACMHDSCMLHGDTHALHRLHAANSNISLRAFKGHGKKRHPIIWGCGRVAMRAVGGWAPSAQKTNVNNKLYVRYIYNGTRIFGKVHVLGTAAQQYHDNFSHGACGMMWPCARGVVLGTAAPKYRKNNRVGPEPGGLLIRPRGPVSHFYDTGARCLIFTTPGSRCLRKRASGRTR